MLSFIEGLSPQKRNFLFWFLILFFTYTNFFSNYWNPRSNLWDETFHIASASKYIQKVHFMEPHPPLGKLLIAAGEVLLRPITGQYETFNLEKTEESARYVPPNFTPMGYRFFPVLFGCINVILFTLLLLHFLKSKILVLAFSPLFLFENSLIAHSRAAMLDNFLIFGVLLSLLSFFKLLSTEYNSRNKIKAWAYSALMVLGFSFAFMTKAFGLFLLVLWPLLCFFKRKSEDRKILQKAVLPQILFSILFFHAIWFIHIQLGQNINPYAPNNGFYAASETTQKILKKEAENISGIRAFYTQLADNLKYAAVYQTAVVPFSIYHGSTSGSFPIMWPFGSRPMSYLEGESSRGLKHMLAFVPNPINWFTALISLLLVGGILLNHKTLCSRLSNNEAQALISLSILYLSYMIPLLFIRRILYLNHYITPLILSFLILILVWKLLLAHTPSRLLRMSKKLSLYLFPLLSISAFIYFKPLTYMEELSCDEMNARMSIRFWDMRHPNCPHPASRNKEMFKEFPVIENKSEAMPSE